MDSTYKGEEYSSAAVFQAQLAAGFCGNRRAERILDHSWRSTERWPNEFTLTMQTGMRSIVITFLMCFTLHKFVYMAQVRCKLPKVKVSSGEEMLGVRNSSSSEDRNILLQYV